MAPSDASSGLPSIDANTMTPAVLVGSLMNFFFFGALLIQVYVYAQCFHQDPCVVKCIVYFILLTEVSAVCVNGWDAYQWFAVSFGDVTALLNPRNSPFYAGVVGGLNGLIVQFFFCYRIVVIRRSAWPMAALIALFSLTQCATGMASGIYAYVYPIEEWSTGALIVFPTWLAGSALVEILIAATMTYLLISATGSVQPSTRDLIKALVGLIIETNIFTAAVAIAALALFLGRPKSNYFVGPTWNLSGIYANTLLTILNNRARPRRSAVEGWGEDTVDISFARTDTVTSVGSIAEMTFAGRQSGAFQRTGARELGGKK
ncbi:hypothetical protein B0H15DRAFT_20990 [Mycena belliarum]|uniref:DUF6534 domain-containing protein n=1 Tax=Mycena belliarum TaxID=1033014 RepID=A0AAD6UIR7_9AGAR|nr:hypothetical protein B0H15DRAFT_20990 [Mycena belliae]